VIVDNRVVAARVSFYSVPTESFGERLPESDGTAIWDHTGVLLVELSAEGYVGLGYSYTSAAAGTIVKETLFPLLLGSDPMDTTATFWQMAQAVRNLGWPGICANAISAIDLALTDLKATILDVPVVQLLGGGRTRVAAYGSGGFTNYTIPQLQEQLSGWAQSGLTAVKMKVGRQPDRDVDRVRAAREAIGPSVELFVDANGAYTRKQALGLAHEFAEAGVSWLEEPVSSDDLEGLRLLRDRGPVGMQIAAGEYGYTPNYFHKMLAAGAVDILQADATRCGGATGFLLAAAQAVSAALPLSAHTAPSVHASLGSATSNTTNVEFFHDHARIEAMFFDGAAEPSQGWLEPDRSRPGLGLSFKRADATPYLVSTWTSDTGP
jgi:L-alanine-DL-glutamate epimerase-like enolase superfamily enzyme